MRLLTRLRSFAPSENAFAHPHAHTHASAPSLPRSLAPSLTLNRCSTPHSHPPYSLLTRRLCDEAVKQGFDAAKCNAYLQDQRQVCMFMSQAQTARISVALQVLGTRGVTVFGSSGDGGSHFSFQRFQGGGALGDALNQISCSHMMPVYPTGSPYIVSVGGTQWQGSDGSNPVAWSGGGGGFAWQFAAPPHQAAAVASYFKAAGKGNLPAAGSYNASGRAYPDVSAVAIEGTSQSSPIMAGVFALVADHRLNAGLPPLGFVAPRLWQVGTSSPGEAFFDVSEGNTKTSCATGFPARTGGWDPVTGWGRPKWAGLLKHFGSDAHLNLLE